MSAQPARPAIHPAAPFPRLRVPIPLFEAQVQAGFPSPAEGYLQRPIDLNELLVRNPPSTFMVRAEGESMIHAPIQSGDLLIVDRSLEAHDGSIVLAVIDGEFTVKTLRKTRTRAWLQGLAASAVCVFLVTNRHRPEEPQYNPQAGRELIVPTAFTPELIGECRRVLKAIYRPGFR